MATTDSKSRTRSTVWDLPDTGLPWCDCGKAHPLTAQLVRERAESLGFTFGQEMTHRQLVKLAMEVWNYVAVCRFFHLQLNGAVEFVYGRLAPSYPYAQGINIVGYFSKTWQGCPEEACQGDENLEFED